jgi:glycosyltransferase involved in cell wall biosynthesis
MKVLIISNNEICYNPRLLKAADYLTAKNVEVVVFNPIIGIADEDTYRRTIQNRPYRVIEFDISKRNFSSKLRWLWVSIIFGFMRFFWDRFRLKWGFKYYMNRGLFGFREKYAEGCQFIVINLVDNLPMAAMIKGKYKARIIYDSQEYFRGQYSNDPDSLRSWVEKAEGTHIVDVDFLMATTNAMLDRIIDDYQIKIPHFRVRNLPSLNQFASSVKQRKTNILKIVWHGMSIYFNNRRGVTRILEALSKTTTPCHLYLQGKLPTDQERILHELMNKFNIQGRVTIVPAADPDEIVRSLINYDVGVSAEIAFEENQALTSSNKLFEYIAAGLAVLCSNLPGLAETLTEYNVGILYNSGSADELASKIDYLNQNNEVLKSFQSNAAKFSRSDLFWENDYEKVYRTLLIK